LIARTAKLAGLDGTNLGLSRTIYTHRHELHGHELNGPLAACGGIIASATAFDRIEDFGTARGRIGWAFDRVLVYATGGASWQTLKGSYAVTAAGVTTPLFSSTTTRLGYAIGGGVETPLWGNWIGGLEYLFLDSGTFGTGTASLAPIAVAPAGSTLSTVDRIQNSIVRARLSYKF